MPAAYSFFQVSDRTWKKEVLNVCLSSHVVHHLLNSSLVMKAVDVDVASVNAA